MFPFKEAIKAIDLFGQPIQFSFNRKTFHKSFFGGVNTIVLLTIFMVIAFQGFLEIALRANITSFTTDIYPSQPPYIQLNPTSMNWAISFNPFSLNVWGDIGKFFKGEVYQGIYIHEFYRYYFSKVNFI